MDRPAAERELDPPVVLQRRGGHCAEQRHQHGDRVARHRVRMSTTGTSVRTAPSVSMGAYSASSRTASAGRRW